MNVAKIKQLLIDKYQSNDFVTDKTGCKTVEIINASFEADKYFIVREPNYDYIARELEWYESQSLDVNDIPGNTPAIWKAVSDKDGKINSNYGYLVLVKTTFRSI
jgi:thymidylate synthase